MDTDYNGLKDTANLVVLEQRTATRLLHVQLVFLRVLVEVEDEGAPRVDLLRSSVQVGLDGEEGREVVLPWPLEAAPLGRHFNSDRSHDPVLTVALCIAVLPAQGVDRVY